MTLLSYIHTIGVKGLKETACNNAALEEEVCPKSLHISPAVSQTYRTEYLGRFGLAVLKILDLCMMTLAAYVVALH